MEGIPRVAGVDIRRLPKLVAIKNNRIVRTAGGTVRSHFIAVPRFRPYLGIELGKAELDGGFIWSIKFDRPFREEPSVHLTGFGYVELPVIHIKLPMPWWLHKVDRYHFEVFTLPVGRYKFHYLAVGKL